MLKILTGDIYCFKFFKTMILTIALMTVLMFGYREYKDVKHILTVYEDVQHTNTVLQKNLRTVNDKLTGLTVRFEAEQEYVYMNLEELMVTDLETDYRIEMLSGELLQYRIELDGMSHEGCNSIFAEVFKDLEYLRRMVE